MIRNYTLKVDPERSYQQRAAAAHNDDDDNDDNDDDNNVNDDGCLLTEINWNYGMIEWSFSEN